MILPKFLGLNEKKKLDSIFRWNKAFL